MPSQYKIDLRKKNRVRYFHPFYVQNLTFYVFLNSLLKVSESKGYIIKIRTDSIKKNLNSRILVYMHY